MQIEFKGRTISLVNSKLTYVSMQELWKHEYKESGFLRWKHSWEKTKLVVLDIGIGCSTISLTADFDSPEHGELDKIRVKLLETLANK